MLRAIKHTTVDARFTTDSTASDRNLTDPVMSAAATFTMIVNGGNNRQPHWSHERVTFTGRR